MATRPQTPYYSLQLPREDGQDQTDDLSRILSQIATILAFNQKPNGISIRWGDATNGRYIECNSQGIQIRGDANYSLALAKNFRFNSGTSFPVDYLPGVPFFRTDVGAQGTLYLRLASSWMPISFVTEGAVRDAGALMIDDMGAGAGDVGAIPYYLEAGVFGTLVPSGHVRHIMVADADDPSGWRFVLPEGAVAEAYPSQGAIMVGLNLGEAVFLEFSEDPTEIFMMRDVAEDGGFRYVSAVGLVGQAFANQGELLVGTGLGTAAVAPAGTTNGDVLTRDSTQATGVRWVPRSQLGYVPGVGVNSAARTYALNHFV